jgi:4-amino-4-deoxy-L-arabinose transferase-like glycosyltransferase
VVGVVVGLVLAVSIVLRFVTRSDLWLDEALSVNIARLPLGDIPDALRRDGAPPLYYVLLHFWIDLFGEGDGAVRALSGLLSVATLPAMYFAGRRIGGRAAAWAAVLVLATSPFAIRYATETRMYALVMFIVAWGYLALVRALERPSVGRLALVVLATAALLYSHNWSWYLLATVGLLVVGIAWKATDADRRRAARRVAIAMVVGGVCYLPWVPTLLDQLAKTGTPWADARLPWSGLMDVFDGIGGVGAPIHGEALFLRTVLTVLFLLGVFAVGLDPRRMELDLHTRPRVRWESAAAFGTLLLGLTLSWAAGTAFVSRYSSVVVPLLALVIAAGIAAFVGTWGRVLVLAAVVVLGLAGGVRNVVDDRTQAAEIANVIAAEAVPGDVVVYCPDQLGPAVSRLLPDDLGVEQVTFPDLRRPEIVNWVDYRKRIAATDAGAVARRVLERAGDRTVWYVASPGYRSVEGQCEALGGALAASRPGGSGRIAPDDTNYFEYMGLSEYPGS